MTLDRRDFKTSIPQLEARLKELEKVGENGLSNFNILQDLIEKEIQERQRLYLKQETSLDTMVVKMYYALVDEDEPTPPLATEWSETMPNIDSTAEGMVLWHKSKTLRNGVVTNETAPQKVQLMDGVFSFINSIASDSGWTTINGSTISTGKIQSHDGNTYFDLDNNLIHMTGASYIKDRSVTDLVDKVDTTEYDLEHLEIGGKNLLAFSSDTYMLPSTKVAGLTATLEDDGFIYVSGTSTATSATIIAIWGVVSDTIGTASELFGEGTYTLSVENENLLDNGLKVQLRCLSPNEADYLDTTGSLTKEIASGQFISRVCIIINSNSTGRSYDGRVRIKLEKGDKATDWTPAPEDVKEYTDSSVDAITEKVRSENGSLVTIADASDFPALDLTTDIDPIQDLNGYDKPWVGGAGKNLLNANMTPTLTTGTTLTVSGDRITVEANGASTYQSGMYGKSSNLIFPAGTYYVKCNVVSIQNAISSTCMGFRNANNIFVSPTIPLTSTGNKAITVTLTQACYFSITITWGATGTANKVVIDDLMISATDVPYEPYENICPISGSTEVKTTACGKNLLRDSNTMDGWWESSGATISGGVATLTGSTSNWDGAFGTPKLDPKLLDGSTKYVLSFDYNCTASCALYVAVAGTAQNVDSASFARSRYTGWQSPQPTLSSTSGQWQRFSLNARTIDVSQLGSGSGDVNSWFAQIYARSNVTLQVRNVQIEISANASEYEAYNGNTYTTALGGTVYGGTLDVTSGELTVDRIAYTVGGLSWDYDSAGTRFITKTSVDLSQLKTPTSSAIPAENSLSSAYKLLAQNVFSGTDPNGAYMLSTGTRISVRDTRYTTVSDFTTNMGTAQLVFTLATPLKYQLEPQQIMLLQGTNNIWSSSGDVSVKYAIIGDASQDIYQRLFSDTDRITTQLQNTATKTALQEVSDLAKEYLGANGYINMGGAGLEIGSGNYSVVLSPEAMVFYDKGQGVASISNKELIINNTRVSNSMRMGNFLWSITQEGRLILKYAEEGA